MSSRKVPRTVIPDTIEGVAGLLVARRWEKAAIVYAWTLPEESGGRPPKSRANTLLFNIAQFAELDIAGLRDAKRVRAYRNAWVWAIEQGLAEMVGPGDEINLDDLDTVTFPGPTGSPAYAQTPHDDAYEAEAEAAGISADAAKRAGSNKKAIEAAVVADPEVAQAAARGLDKRYRKQADERKQRVTDKMGPAQPVISKSETETVLDAALNLMDAAIEEGERRHGIHALQKLAAEGRRLAEQWVEQFGHTGVADEIEWLHEMSADLTEWQWKMTSAIVDAQDVR